MIVSERRQRGAVPPNVSRAAFPHGTNSSERQAFEFARHASTTHIRYDIDPGLGLTADELNRIRRLLSKADREERLRVKGLDAKRVDLIVPAAYVAEYTGRAPARCGCLAPPLSPAQPSEFLIADKRR